MISGIYYVKNLVTNKVYIGSSNDIQRRWSEHQSDLRSCTHDNDHLQKSYNKYGEESFEYEILEEITELDGQRLDEALLVKEDFYINKFDSLNPKFGYNLLSADRHYMSELVRKKMSESRKGDKNPMKKESSKIALSKTLTGKKLSKEHRAALSEHHADVSGKNNPMYGKYGGESSFYGRKHSDETKEKLRKAMTGRVFTEEHKQKLSESHKGNKLSHIAKQKVSQYQKSRTMALKRKKQMQHALEIARNTVKSHVCPICGYEFQSKNSNPKERCDMCKMKGAKIPK